MIVGNTTAAATAPTGTNTVVLLNTYTALQRTPLDAYNITRYIATILNSQAGTINLYESTDGVGWRKFVTRAVAAPSIDDSGPIDFAVEGIVYLKVEWVNGGVDQVGWKLTQALIENQRAAQT